MGWYIFADDLPEVPCVICTQQVKHGDKVYFETFPSRPMHAVCVWERAEKDEGKLPMMPRPKPWPGPPEKKAEDQ
jgi:hypothetical protein